MPKVFLNTFTDSQFRNEVVPPNSKVGVKVVNVIRNWVLGEEKNLPSGGKRLAPSLVARSDAELFGVSVPRFGMRYYLDERCKSFINMRRAALLAVEAKGLINQAPETPSPDYELDTGDVDLNQLFQLVGDCFLEVPIRFNKEYKCVTTKLGASYGEELREEHGVDGTSFVSYSELSGVCAQACCLIASAALKDYASGIFGLPEISDLATRPSPDGVGGEHLEVRALSTREMLNFFRHPMVGLWASYQTAHQLENPTCDFSIFHREILRSYLLSGMPIICQVDYNRLWGRVPQTSPQLKDGPILGENDTGTNPIGMWNKTSGIQAYQPVNHMVTLIGCGRDVESSRLLLHDPLSVPYLEASVSQLEDAAPYCGDEADRIQNMLSVSPGHFIAVTPPQVKLALCDSIEPNQNSLKGLHFISLLLQQYAFSELRPFGVEFRPNLAQSKGAFRLCRLADIDSIADSDEWGIGFAPRMSSQVQVLKKRLYAIYDETHWCWVQKFSDSLWVWDAQCPGLALNEAEKAQPEYLWTKYLMGVVGVLGDATPSPWIPARSLQERRRTSIESDISSNSISPEAPRCSDDLAYEVAIITSFDGGGLISAVKNWPTDYQTGVKLIKSAELYTFMQKDAEYYLRKYLPNPNAHNALSMMAALANREDILERLAQDLHSDLDGICVRSMATFLPELLDGPHDSERVKQAALALQFVTGLCKALRNLKCGHDPQVIELVAGSGTDRVGIARHKESTRERVFIAKRLTPSENADRLMQNLLGNNLRDHLESSNVRLAVEIEPGPLFAISDANSLRVLIECFRSKKYQELSGLIGVNLDIGHWAFLSRIDKELVLANGIEEFIYHSHISDQGVGHFGDAPINAIHKKKDYTPWIDLVNSAHLKNVSPTREHSKPLISLELECAATSDVVQHSVKQLISMLT